MFQSLLNNSRPSTANNIFSSLHSQITFMKYAELIPIKSFYFKNGPTGAVGRASPSYSVAPHDNNEANWNRRTGPHIESA